MTLSFLILTDFDRDRFDRPCTKYGTNYERVAGKVLHTRPNLCIFAPSIRSCHNLCPKAVVSEDRRQ